MHHIKPYKMRRIKPYNAPYKKNIQEAPYKTYRKHHTQPYKKHRIQQLISCHIWCFLTHYKLVLKQEPT